MRELLGVLFCILVLFFVSCSEVDKEVDPQISEIDPIFVSTHCHNPTSLSVYDKTVYVVCSGDYIYDDQYNYVSQKDSGIELYGSDSLNFINVISGDSSSDYGKIVRSGVELYVGSTQTGRMWTISNNVVSKVEEVGQGAQLPYCNESLCLVLSQNSGSVYIQWLDGSTRVLDLSDSTVEYPWFVSPIVVDDSLYILNSSIGVVNKYSLYGEKVWSREVGQLYPNDMTYHDGWFYILDSQNNTVDRVSINGDYENNYIDLGLDANPYAISVWNGSLIIACYNSGYLYGYDLSRNVLTQLNVNPINQPSAIDFDSLSIYVLASEYESSGSGGKLYKFTWY